MQTVVVKATTPCFYDSVFNYCDNLTQIIVPTSAVEAYKSATGWSTYASKIVGGAENY